MIREEIFAFDIETIPSQNLPDDCMPKFDPGTVALGNLKDPLKIRDKIEKERKEFEEGLIKRMSLDPYLCHILCFTGMRFDTTSNEVVKEKTLFLGDYNRGSIDTDDERELIDEACDMIKQARNDKTLIVTFNGAQFDFPVLQASAMRLDVPVTVEHWVDFMRRYGHWSHCDLMQELARWDRQRWKSLNFYVHYFGLGSKLENVDGSQVYNLWMKGQDDLIMAYNREDAFLVAQLYARVGHWVTPERPSDVFDDRSKNNIRDKLTKHDHLLG